jgi:hypothetical protein
LWIIFVYKIIDTSHEDFINSKKLIKIGLEKVWPDTSKPIIMREIIIAF